jgi:hypothetical protein
MTLAMVKVLPEPGDAEQDLRLLILLHRLDQFGDGGGLVSGRLIFADQPERAPAFGLFGARRAVRDKARIGLRLSQTRTDLNRHVPHMALHGGGR